MLQAARVSQLESEVSTRDAALEILRREYESAKARVRRCREEHRRGSSMSLDSQVFYLVGIIPHKV